MENKELKPEQITLEMLENGDPRITPELLFDGTPATPAEPERNYIADLYGLLGKSEPEPMSENDKADMRSMAEYYISAGISVIPVGKNKIPLLPWKTYQEKRATIDEVDTWLSTYPDMQLGIVTGKISNLIVVDVEKGGDWSWLPMTAVAKTGGGGRHYYYSYVPGFTNKARIKELVDIRADGGYVIAPPSHSDKGSYEWLNKTQPILFPKYLFEPKPETILKPEFSIPIGPVYAGANEGNRNDSMTRYVGAVLRAVHPSGWDTIAWQKILDANAMNTPPLPERELMIIFTSIKGAEQRSSQFRYQITTPPNPSDLWDNEDDEILQMGEAASRESFDIGAKVSTGFEIFDDAFNGGFNDGDLIIVAGQSGHGKTSFAQTLTYNFVSQVYPTLWFSYEVLTPYLWEKFKTMGMNEEWFTYIPLKHVTGNLSWVKKKVKEAKEKYMAKVVVIDHLGFLAPGLLEDNKLNRDVRGDNYSLYLASICRELKNFAMNERIIIVLMAHLKKVEGDESLNHLYGSIAIAQESDAVFMINRELSTQEEEGDYFTPYTKIVIMKNRKTGRTFKTWFTMQDEKFIHVADYKPQKISKKKSTFKVQYKHDD